MDSRTRVIKTLKFEEPDRAPRDLWYLPGIDMFRRAELDAMFARFPTDIAGAPVKPGKGKRAKGIPNVVGTYVDDWGAVWHVGEPGVIGEVKQPALADWSELATYTPPYETLENADFSAVNPFCAESNKFVIGHFGTLFERMQFVRGTEQLYMDLAYGTDEVLKLRDMIHEFNMQFIERWCETDVDAIAFNDDWGAQHALLISPNMWREVFKPLYKQYVSTIHAAGKFSFMHSDGHITAIYPDIIEIGIDALNSQLFCMDIEALARQYKGQITFWGEIDRQRLLPFGTPDEVRAAVQRVRVALDDGKGGVIAEGEWGIGVPAENIAAMFEAWL